MSNKFKILQIVKYILFICVIFLIGFIAGGYSIHYDLVDFIEPSSYEIIAKEVATARPYERGVYDCDDMTYALMDRLGEEDILVIPEYGQIVNESGDLDNHAWAIVCMPVESTTGEIIDLDTYHNDYIKR